MLSQESKNQIDREVAKYPAEQKQSAVMAALAFDEPAAFAALVEQAKAKIA